MAAKRDRTIVEAAKSAGRLELQDGIWLWSIRQQGKKLTIGYGRRGGPIPEVSTSFGGAAAAQAALIREVRKALKKGFRTPQAVAQEASQPASPQAASGDEQRRKWEEKRQKEMAAEKHALDARLGAPMAALLDFTEEELLVEEGGGWTGQKPPRLCLMLEDSSEIGETLARLKAVPTAGDLEWLAIHLVYGTTYREAVAAVTRKGLPSWLKTLTLCSFRNIEDFDANQGDPSPVYPLLGGLERLEINAGTLALGKMDFPNLRELQVRAWGLQKDALRSITAAKWPALERLSLWFGGALHGADCTAEDLDPILSGRQFPKLKHLQLMTTEFTDLLAWRLATADILPRLKSLDLSYGTLSDAGAAALKKKAAAFKHLRKLAVRENLLSKHRISELSRALPNLDAGEQREPGNWVRATGVEHYVPLYAGDNYILLNGIDDEKEEAPLELDLDLDRGRK